MKNLVIGVMLGVGFAAEAQAGPTYATGTITAMTSTNYSTENGLFSWCGQGFWWKYRSECRPYDTFHAAGPGSCGRCGEQSRVRTSTSQSSLCNL